MTQSHLKKKKQPVKDSTSDLPIQNVNRIVKDTAVTKFADTTIKPLNDTIIYKLPESLTAPVTYHADDSMVFDVPGKG